LGVVSGEPFLFAGSQNCEDNSATPTGLDRAMFECKLFGAWTLGEGSFLGYGELPGMRKRAAKCAAATPAEAKDASTDFDGQAEFRALALIVTAYRR